MAGCYRGKQECFLISTTKQKERCACGKENVFGGRMPLDETNATLMSDQIGDWSGEVSLRLKATLGDLPDLGSAILGARGDEVIVVRTPLDVKHGSPVASH